LVFLAIFEGGIDWYFGGGAPFVFLSLIHMTICQHSASWIGTRV